MDISRLLVLTIVFQGLFLSTLGAESLREELKDIDVASHWIYDDLPQAMAEAKTTGKPLMIVLRCVPCPPGRTLDTQVMQPNAGLEEVEKRFVCVRLIQTKGLDLNVFQFDYDMSWAAMFINADQTIYGRYGTRTASGPGSDSQLHVDGFRKAAERALALHEQYPSNRAELAGKTGSPADYRRPELIPGLQERGAAETTRRTCIHCHMVREYALRAKWEQGRLSETDLWVDPMPERIGLTMDTEDGLMVQNVASDSPGAKAGIQVGDQLVSMQGQPLISTADIQWVLHRSPADVQLPVVVRRDGAKIAKTVSLSGDWKKTDISWRASSWYGLRAGFRTEMLPDLEKRALGLPSDRLALQVKGLFGKAGPVLKQAGIQTGDVIIAVDGKSDPMTETDFLACLRLQHGPNDSISLTLQRENDRRTVTVPLW